MGDATLTVAVAEFVPPRPHTRSAIVPTAEGDRGRLQQFDGEPDAQPQQQRQKGDHHEEDGQRSH
jgi:hypothetical protein